MCEQCLWPICGTECVTPNFLTLNMHDEECKVLTFAADKIAKTNDYMYDALTPLRCLLLQLGDKNKWNRLIGLQSHMEHRGPNSEIYEYVRYYYIVLKIKIDKILNILREISLICNYLRGNYLSEVEFEASSELIHKVCGILDVNALDVQISGAELTAVYSTVSMLEHSCLPNVCLSFDKFGHISVNVARKVVK